jgi:hypothetical protein
MLGCIPTGVVFTTTWIADGRVVGEGDGFRRRQGGVAAAQVQAVGYFRGELSGFAQVPPHQDHPAGAVLHEQGVGDGARRSAVAQDGHGLPDEAMAFFAIAFQEPFRIRGGADEAPAFVEDGVHRAYQARAFRHFIEKRDYRLLMRQGDVGAAEIEDPESVQSGLEAFGLDPQGDIGEIQAVVFESRIMHRGRKGMRDGIPEQGDESGGS